MPRGCVDWGMRMSEFFAMDGYAQFVWPAYAITAVVMAWAALRPWLRHRRLRQRLAGGAK